MGAGLGQRDWDWEPWQSVESTLSGEGSTWGLTFVCDHNSRPATTWTASPTEGVADGGGR